MRWSWKTRKQNSNNVKYNYNKNVSPEQKSVLEGYFANQFRRRGEKFIKNYTYRRKMNNQRNREREEQDKRNMERMQKEYDEMFAYLKKERNFLDTLTKEKELELNAEDAIRKREFIEYSKDSEELNKLPKNSEKYKKMQNNINIKRAKQMSNAASRHKKSILKNIDDMIKLKILQEEQIPETLKVVNKLLRKGPVS